MADFTEIRNELRDFYGTKLDGLHNENIEKCLKVLDNGIPKDIPAIIQKKMQYKLLADNVHPVLFRNTVLFGEVCANKAIECSDTIGNYTLNINKELYHKLAADVFDARNEAQSYPLYMFCGEFGDEKYHFAFNNEKILKQGFKGIYERVMARLNESNLPDDERLWLEAVKEATLAVKTIAEAFMALANKKAEGSADSNEREHYLTVAELSSRIPWEKPETFVEALCTVQFIQSVVPFLEGGGLYSVGRLDLMLIDFYRHDIDKGILTPDEAEKLIGEFLLLHDMRIPHEQENQRDSLVNACYTLGGIDRKGNYVFNELTRAFLKLDNELEIIYPKIKCRYDKGSPKEYLDLINTELKNGKSTLLYQNDSAIIPSFINSGVDSEDARDYSILGCWEPVIPGATNEHCSYFLTLKIYELSVYGGIKTSNFEILPLEEAKSFDEVLAITLKNIHGVMESRCHVAVTARPHWYEVDPHPLLSSVVDDCIERGKDITNGGTKYSFDEIICAGLPNVIDSLLAIKELCFDTKKYTLTQFLDAVRANWENTVMRNEALNCHFFGDETDESISLMKTFLDDFEAFAGSLPALWGGRVTIGYMLFMEEYWMKDCIRATPDGRFSHDFFARGLTPSYLHKIDSISQVINSFNAIGESKAAANNVLNVTLPFGDLPLSAWEMLIRATAYGAISSLQINCTSKEELLDAIEHPENHQSLIVRVCGFSARFVSLPKHVQLDFIERNFYES